MGILISLHILLGVFLIGIYFDLKTYLRKKG